MASNGNNTRAQGSNWRALGDIGNLVGALSQRCIVSKDGLLLKNPIAAAKQQLDRPITRQYVALNSQQFALKSSATAQAQKDRGDEAKNVACGAAKHRRTSRGRDPVSDVLSNVTTEATSAATTTSSFEPMSEDGQRNSTQKQHSLTAMLRARSEVTTACAGFEVEMEEADDFFHNVVDIDEADVGNQLAVVDYIEDLTAFYRKTEMQSCVAQDYMSRQADINEKMRAILIDWLIEVHLKFKLMPETLFLAINLIDRFLASECSVLRKELQLVGVTAMLIACKYEEIWAPEVQDFVFISDNAYTRDQVLAMEKTVLNRLKFNLTVPTPYVFLVRFLKAASPSSSSSSSDTQREMLALFLVELCLTEYSMLCYSPSMVAAAAVYTAHRTLHTLPFWTPTLQHHTGYQELQLRECSNKMVEFHNNAGKGKLLVVHNKYSTHKFSSVATLDPFSISSQP